MSPSACLRFPMLHSGFASHALADELRAGASQLQLSSGVRILPLQVLSVQDLERLEPYLADREFTMEECFRAKINEDPDHQWAFWDFVRLRYFRAAALLSGLTHGWSAICKGS